jgi:hypothetical protein
MLESLAAPPPPPPLSVPGNAAALYQNALQVDTAEPLHRWCHSWHEWVEWVPRFTPVRGDKMPLGQADTGNRGAVY